MRLMDLIEVMSPYQTVDIYRGTKLLVLNCTVENIPPNLKVRKIRSVDIINNRVDLEVE